MITLLKPPARFLARLVGLLLLATLAIAGLALAVFSIQGGSNSLSLPELAKLLALPALERNTGDLLSSIEAAGPIALLTAVCGLGVILLGVFLLLGALGRREEPLFIAENAEEGTLAAKRKPLASIADALAEQTKGVKDAKATASPSRSGGFIGVQAARHRSTDPEDLSTRVDAQLEPLRSGFGLKTRVRTVEGSRGRRVE